jgi:hypothetical protein
MFVGVCIMELLKFENGQLVRYNVTYNKDDMDRFLHDIIDKYGCFEYLRNEKAKSKNKFLSRFDECRDIDIVDVHIDDTRVRKGRKRVPKKHPDITYTFNLTGINYPEIYWTIKRFLSQKILYFSDFAKYVNADAVDYNDIEHYIVEGRMGYNRDSANLLQVVASVDEGRKQYIDEKTNNRLSQRECLREFYNLLIIERIQDQPEIYDSLSLTYQALFARLGLMPGIFDSKYLSDVNKIIREFIPTPGSLEKLCEKAKINSEIIDSIVNNNSPKVKIR